MTTLELFKKHRQGEVSRERFLYEVRRDSNLPWVTNTTSYDDAVKILKNKGIIREAQFEPQNVPTDRLVDYVNPYALKREVEKLLSKEKVLNNDSYKEAVNKAAKKLTTPQAVKKAILANADEVEKADAKLQMTPVKKGNHTDKHNGMKKAKGQTVPKATASSTKENRKGKPKGVKVMPDKGVEGSEKIIKEIANYVKKKLTENSSYHDFHEGMQVPTPHGEGIVKEILGGTLSVQCEDGKLYDVQMNVVSELMKKAKEDGEQTQEAYDMQSLGGHQGGMDLAGKLADAIDTFASLPPDQQQSEIDRLKTDLPAEMIAKLEDLMDYLHDEGNYPEQDEELEEKVGKVTDKNTGETVQLFQDPSKAQQFINTQPSNVRSQLQANK